MVGAVAILALVISVLALSVSIWQAVMARRSGQLQRATFEVAQRAWISVHLGAPAVHGEGNAAYEFLLTNVGQAYARHLVGWVEDRRGQRLTNPQMSRQGPLAPGGETRITFAIPLGAVARLRGDAYLQLRWDDWQGMSSPPIELAPGSRVVRFDPESEWARSHLE